MCKKNPYLCEPKHKVSVFFMTRRENLSNVLSQGALQAILWNFQQSVIQSALHKEARNLWTLTYKFKNHLSLSLSLYPFMHL